MKIFNLLVNRYDHTLYHGIDTVSMLVTTLLLAGKVHDHLDTDLQHSCDNLITGWFNSTEEQPGWLHTGDNLVIGW